MKRLIEDILRDYPLVDQYIKDREQELMHPVRDNDENIGGGKSGKISKPQEQMIITLEEDRRLNQLKKQRDVVEECLDNSSDNTKNIIKELYFRKYPRYQMEGLIDNHIIYCNRSQAFKLRNEFIEQIAKELNIFI
ncbi:transcriptional regulator [Companilactobacillus allii]|uniref:transcriptional regulator n=1 Tax=Companilactobacillus allii TaxID=1847728 RepID=UPI001CEF6938|nr:transcriptional regulator [Companilactobacillus allii]USQ69808.1 transcriptional regulator [Companilactobacillus allii]